MFEECCRGVFAFTRCSQLRVRFDWQTSSNSFKDITPAIPRIPKSVPAKSFPVLAHHLSKEAELFGAGITLDRF